MRGIQIANIITVVITLILIGIDYRLMQTGVLPSLAGLTGIVIAVLLMRPINRFALRYWG